MCVPCAFGVGVTPFSFVMANPFISSPRTFTQFAQSLLNFWRLSPSQLRDQAHADALLAKLKQDNVTLRANETKLVSILR